MKIPIASIKIGPRQRIDLGDIDELADSITRIGQIHNIGIRAEDNQLIWGRRRLAACTQLGWTEIEATVREGLSEEQEQEIELEEDIKRKERTWQERALAVAKLFRIKYRAALAKGEKFNIRDMAEFTGLSKTTVAEYVYKVADGLSVLPKDDALWACSGFSDALQLLRARAEREAAAELERRRQEKMKTESALSILKKEQPGIFATVGPANESHVQIPDKTSSAVLPVQEWKPSTKSVVQLSQRAVYYNDAYRHLGPPNTPLYYEYDSVKEREFISGHWFVSGGNISDLYGSYQVEYLKRIATLFPDKQRVVHLFVGSLPPSDKYVRVGLPQGETKPDIICDAHELSSHLPFKADLIYADPPYSVEDSEHYQNSMVNRERVLEECALSLADDGFIVWLDQALPVFKNELLELVGFIGYIRSTGNRFRCVSIFRRNQHTILRESPKSTAELLPWRPMPTLVQPNEFV